jgi:hypothetical protein
VLFSLAHRSTSQPRGRSTCSSSRGAGQFCSFLCGGGVRSMADLCSDELLELLLRGDGGGGVHQQPSPTNLRDVPLTSSSTSGNHPWGKETASEAQMASWLCQVFQQEPRPAAIPARTKSEEGANAVVPSSSAGAGGYLRVASAGAASGAAVCGRGRSSCCGRRRPCSGKAAEQVTARKSAGCTHACVRITLLLMLGFACIHRRGGGTRSTTS